MGKFRDRGTVRGAIDREIGRTIFAAADLLRVEAQLLITRGAISGKNHVPSRPGDPPNNDTGTLANHIEAEKLSELRARVTSSAPYAIALEYGTSKMDARPYMRPAAMITRPEIEKLLAGAVQRAVRRHYGR